VGSTGSFTRTFVRFSRLTGVLRDAQKIQIPTARSGLLKDDSERRRHVTRRDGQYYKEYVFTITLGVVRLTRFDTGWRNIEGSRSQSQHQSRVLAFVVVLDVHNLEVNGPYKGTFPYSPLP
jgi:hypothetical protein